MQSIIELEFSKHIAIAQVTLKYIANPLEDLVDSCIGSLQNNGKMLIFGN